MLVRCVVWWLVLVVLVGRCLGLILMIRLILFLFVVW